MENPFTEIERATVAEISIALMTLDSRSWPLLTQAQVRRAVRHVAGEAGLALWIRYKDWEDRQV